jgi:hypothetical protein
LTRRGPAVLAALLGLVIGTLIDAGALRAQTLSPDQMRGHAVRAIDKGQPALALHITQALLDRDTDDVTALILRARAARDLGRFDIAQPAAARAWSLARTPAARFDSARVMAQILSSQGQRSRAQLWLRRAVQHAPDPSARQLAVRDYRYVSARNRWQTQLNLALAPHSNINNGSVKDQTEILNLFTRTYVLADLGGAAQALSGLELSTGGTLAYRLLEDRSHRTDLMLQFDTRRYILSDEARRIAPAAKAADFALDSLNIGIDHRWRNPSAPVEYQLGALLGVTGYGGAHHSDQARLSFGINRALRPQTRIGLALAADVTRGPRAPHADGLRLGMSIAHGQDQGTQLAARLSLSHSRSDSESADYNDIRLDLSAAPAWDLMGATAQFGLSLRARDHDSYTLFSPDGRRDREVALSVTLNLAQAEFYGFIPTLTLEASRTRSNIGLFDLTRYGLQMGVRSAF